MKNKMFSGWREVFLFTLKQGFGQKYGVITLVLAIILFAGGLGINMFLASNQQKDDKISPIEKVYVIDESEISCINWTSSKRFDKKQFPKVVFEQTTSNLREMGMQLNDNDEVTSVISKITKKKDGYEINVYLPYGSEVTKSDGENLAKMIKGILQESLIITSQIDTDKVDYVVSGITTEFCIVGENAKSNNMRLLTTVFPMIFMFGLYFMVVIYGQNMGQIVSIEKSSKLMESLLLMTRPYGLIFGKILATAFTAILQIAVWMTAAFIGFVYGEGLAQNSIYEGYENGVLVMLREIVADESVKAFTMEAIALTFIAVCLAFLFYCMLAGAISSFASKADELGSVMMFYNMFIVIGFLGSYIIPSAVGQEWVKVLIRLLPMSAAFLLPGELLIGTVSAGAGVLYLLVLFAWIVLTAVIAGKVYKDQVFYRGQSIKDRLPWVKKDTSDEESEWQILHDESGKTLEGSQKIGYFFLSISPLAIFIVIQIFASLILTNIMTRVDLNGINLETWEVKDFVDYYHGIEPTLNPLTVMVSHLCIITIFGLWMYFVRKGIDRRNIFHVKSLFGKELPKIVGLCLISGLCLCALANGVVAVESYVVPSIVEEYLEMADSAGMGKNLFAILAAVCMAPIGEELLCRGVCLHFGKKAIGKFWYANILQALLFGILHMNWVQGVYAFVIGLVLGILVERYESLLPAMIVHFIINFSSTTWISKVFGETDITFMWGIMLVTIPGIITVSALYFTRKRQ